MSDLVREGVRITLIVPGPQKTLAGKILKSFGQLLSDLAEVAEQVQPPEDQPQPAQCCCDPPAGQNKPS